MSSNTIKISHNIKKTIKGGIEMEINKDLYIKTYGMKAWREFCKNNRVLNPMNMGTRVMKTGKVYSRKRKHKKEWE